MPVAKRKYKETGGKTGLFGGLKLSMTSDPHKQFAAAAKAVGKCCDAKNLGAVVEAAAKLAATLKGMNEVAIFFGEEFRATGMFNGTVLWTLANQYYERHKVSGAKDIESLDRAIKVMGDLGKAMPNHPEASRTEKNWMAYRAQVQRASAGQASDYRSQVANTDHARRQEVMNRNIRTIEDAREVLGFVDEDLQKNPGDKFLWTKKGEIHRRMVELLGKDSAGRAREFAAARSALERAQSLDQHDFTVTMKLGDLRILEEREKVAALPAGSPELAAAKKRLVEEEIAEFRIRVDRQPTDMGHRFNLATRLIQAGDVDGAAAEFQRTVNDPRLKKSSHRYLGYCFTKKNLLDLAIQQYKLFLPLVEDVLSDEAKEGRYQLARLYEDRGASAEATAEFEKLVAVDLSYKDAAARLGKLRGA
jgi:tetratricopeptide (TPR) repeat protein